MPGKPCPVPVPGRQLCAGVPVWRRRDGLWFCVAHRAGHVHLVGDDGRDLGWWRVELAHDVSLFWIHDDRRGHSGAVYALGALWSVTGVRWALDYGPTAATALLAPAVRYATRATRARLKLAS